MDRETLHAVRTDSFGAGWTAAYTEVTSGDQNRRYIDLLNAHLALASPASPRVETELGCLKADDANAARCRCGYSPDVHLLRDALASLRAAPAPEGETPDGDYAPYWLVALRAANEAIEKHDLWCGHKRGSPGDGSINRAERLVGAAIRRADLNERTQLGYDLLAALRSSPSREDREQALLKTFAAASLTSALAQAEQERDALHAANREMGAALDAIDGALTDVGARQPVMPEQYREAILGLARR